MQPSQSRARRAQPRRLAVKAEARTSDRSPRRHARLAWLDPQTGRALEVELTSSDAFLAELEALGFVRQPIPTPASADSRAPRRSA